MLPNLFRAPEMTHQSITLLSYFVFCPQNLQVTRHNLFWIAFNFEPYHTFQDYIERYKNKLSSTDVH